MSFFEPMYSFYSLCLLSSPTITRCQQFYVILSIPRGLVVVNATDPSLVGLHETYKGGHISERAQYALARYLAMEDVFIGGLRNRILLRPIERVFQPIANGCSTNAKGPSH